MEPTGHSGSPPPCPYSADVTPLYRLAAEQDLAAVYAGLRRHSGPVVAVEIAPGIVGWLVLSHREVLEAIWRADLYSSDPRGWNAVRDGVLPRDTPVLPLLRPRPAVVRLDGEEHLRHRRALTEALARLDPRKLGRLVRNRANALMDAWPAEGTADLVAHFARPLVWHVFAHLLGVSEESVTALDAMSRTVVNALPGAVPAETELLRSLRRVVDERSAAPGPDLTSWLAQDATLSGNEVAHDLLTLTLTGGEGTIGWIGGTLRLLLAYDGPALATSTAALVPSLMERALHTSAPVPTIAGRWATADIVLAGRHIRHGDLVIPCLTAANTDPALGTGTAVRTRAHLAWGTGAHGCPAKETARLITATALEVLLERLTDLSSTLTDSAVRHSSLWSGCPAELPAFFTARDLSAVGHGTGALPVTVVEAPAERRDDRALHEAPPQRWGWWNSFGGW